MPYLRFTILCLIWGASFLLMKRAAAGFSPWTVGAGRVVIGTIVLLIASRWFLAKAPRTLTRVQWPALIGVMLLGYAIPYCVQPFVIGRTQNSALTAMGVGFTPLFTLALSIPVLSVRPTSRQVVGVIGSLGCLALLLVDNLDRSITLFDVVLVFATPVMYAVANNWMRLSLYDVPPLELTVACLGLSGLILIPTACLMPHPDVPSTQQYTLAIGSLLVLGVFSTGLGMLMFNQLVQEQGPLFAVMVTNLTPIGALLLGWFDAERVTILQVIALIGVLTCVVVVQWGGAQRKPDAPARDDHLVDSLAGASGSLKR